MSNFMGAGEKELPVGYVFEFDPTGLAGAPDLSTPEKVHNYFGYGTWEWYGTDRVTVGAGGKYAAGSTGGEFEHTLNINEIPPHAHPQTKVYPNGQVGSIVIENSEGEFSGDTRPEGQNAWLTNKEPVMTWGAGGGQPHNNMQPYISNYRYRRIA